MICPKKPRSGYENPASLLVITQERIFVRLIVSIYLFIIPFIHSFPTAGGDEARMEWCKDKTMRGGNGAIFILNLRIALHFISWESTAVMVDGC